MKNQYIVEAVYTAHKPWQKVCTAISRELALELAKEERRFVRAVRVLQVLAEY
jgi:hypothetical protein